VIEDPLRLATVRDYRAGDSIRHVHWKATARRGSLQTKVFDPGATQTLIVALNTQTLDSPYAASWRTCSKRRRCGGLDRASGVDARRAVGLYTNGGVRDSHRWGQCPGIAARRSASAYSGVTGAVDVPDSHPSSGCCARKRLASPSARPSSAVSPIMNEPIYTALLDLQTAGHPVALVMIGRPLDAELPAVPTYFVTQNWIEMERLEL